MALFGKAKTDPAYAAAQQVAVNLAGQIGNMKLPALPNLPAWRQAQMTPSAPVPTSLPSYLGGGANTVYPAGLPNQLSMIADQLSAGGYGAPQDISAQLSGIYKPMVVAPAPPPAAAAPVKPGVVAKKPGVAVVKKPVTPTPAVKKPMGFTAQQPFYLPPRELNTTGGSLNQGPMFQSVGQFPSDLARYLDSLKSAPAPVPGLRK